MIKSRRGQAAIEAAVAAPLLMILLAAGGACGLVPLAAFFVEDRMEEALVCMTYRPPESCHSLFRKQIRKGLFRQWIGLTTYSCERDECRLTVHWDWPKPFPQQTTRTYSRRVKP